MCQDIRYIWQIYRVAVNKNDLEICRIKTLYKEICDGSMNLGILISDKKEEIGDFNNSWKL